MFRENWKELAFWRWWWANRASGGLRAGLGVFLLLALLGAGLLVADRLSAAKGGTDASDVLQTYVETVNRVTTVHEQGRVVRKLVPVVRKVKVRSRPQTRLETETSFRTLAVTAEGKVRTIRQKVVRRVPVVKTMVVQVAAGTSTVSVTEFRPTTAIETRTNLQTVTNSQTVVNSQTVTNVQTVTTSQTVTNTETETVVQTVTQTRTVTQPVPVTVTVTTPG